MDASAKSSIRSPVSSDTRRPAQTAKCKIARSRRPSRIVGSGASSTAWGQGDEAVLRYLARYVFRVAITNNRIVGLDAAGVRLRHKHRASNRWRTMRLSPNEFMRRFLQHVLPKGLHKVRYYGLWHPTRRQDAARARLLLQQCAARADTEARSSEVTGHADDQPGDRAPADEPRVCPCCKVGHLTHIRRLYPKQATGP